MFNNNLFSQKIILRSFYSLVALISLYIWSKGASIAPDSMGYVYMSPSRSLGYPLFLKAYSFVFGKSYTVLVLLQIAMGVFSIDYFIRTLNKNFSISAFVSILIFLFIFVPYFVLHGIGNYILTEALCYPFFLLTISYIIKLLKSNETKPLLFALFFGVLLTLTRSQFLFLWPGFLILIVYLFYRERLRAQFFSRLILLLSVVISGQLLERAYSYSLTGSFKTAPFVGYQAIVLPFYLSLENNADLFDKPHEKEFFKEAYKKIKEKKLHIDDASGILPIFHYEGNYNTLCHGTLGSIEKKYLDKDPYVHDNQLLSIAITLAKNNIISYARFFLRTIIHGMGGYWSFFILAVLTFLAFIKNLLRPSLIRETFLVLMMLHVGNVMLIAFFEPLIARYTLYTAIPLWSFLLILLSSIIWPLSPKKVS